MKLPKKVFVKVERSRDEEYLVCADDCEALAEEVGGVVEVGTYELVMTGKLATKAEFQADKAKSRGVKPEEPPSFSPNFDKRNGLR